MTANMQEWAQYSLTFVATENEVLVRFLFPNSIEATWEPQAIQLEVGSTATPWIRTDGGPAARAATELDISAEGQDATITNTTGTPAITSGWTISESDGNIITQASLLP